VIVPSKAASFVWSILLSLIFLRPFISEDAFLTAGFWYGTILIIFLSIYLVLSNEIGFFSSFLNFLVLLFVIVILVSEILSGSDGWGSRELYFFIPNILIFYIVNRITPRQKKQLITTIFFAASIISMYAIYQYFIGFRHVLDYIRQSGPNRYPHELLILAKRRVYATFVSPNIFASYIVMMLFVGIGFLLVDFTQRRENVLWVTISIITMLVSLLFTKSLGGIVVFIITFLLFTLYTPLFLLPKTRLKNIILKRAGLGIILGSVVFISIFVIFTQRRLIQFLNLNDPNNSIMQRFYYWIASLKMIKDHLFTGLGWGRFDSLYEFYKLPAANISRYSHNVFLQITAETGLLGLLSFLLIVSIFLRNGYKNIKNSNEQQVGLRIGLFCAGTAFLLHNLVDLSFYFGQVSFFWWIILGLFVNFSSDDV